MSPSPSMPTITAESTPDECARVLASFGSPEGTLMDRMGIELTGLGYDFAAAACPVEGNRQPMGLFHGGGHVVIAETLASMHAAVRTGAGVVGVDLNATHLRSITSGTVYARAQVLHGGRRLFNHEVRMTDADDRLLSIVRITNMVLGG